MTERADGRIPKDNTWKHGKENKMADTIEIIEPEAKKEAPTPPTRDVLREAGWSASELDAAEKRGMVTKPEDAEKAKVEADKKAADEKAKADADAKAKAEAEGKTGEERRTGDIPDFTFKTPEQEKAFLDAFGTGTPQRAMYFRMKNERASRQAAEKERDQERQSRLDLEARIKKLETPKNEPEMDADGNPIDPEDKPLTLKQLKLLQEQEAAEIERRKKELNAQASKVAEAQTAQEEYAREVFPDFDETIEKAKDVMKNLDKLVPEKWKQAKIVNLIRNLQVAAARADQIDLDEYNAAMIAYEIGQLHPTYGQKSDAAKTNGDASDKDGNSKDPKKGNGTLTPEQMKRIEANTQRGASSASVSGGGGKRTISVDDVDLQTLNRMSYSERQKFRQKYPDRYEKLLRG